MSIIELVDRQVPEIHSDTQRKRWGEEVVMELQRLLNKNYWKKTGARKFDIIPPADQIPKKKSYLPERRYDTIRQKRLSKNSYYHRSFLLPPLPPPLPRSPRSRLKPPPPLPLG